MDGQHGSGPTPEEQASRSEGLERAADGERLAMLACSDCGDEKPHRVVYRNDAVAEMSCTVCGRTIALPRSRAASAEAAETTEAAQLTDKAPGGERGLAAGAPRLARTVGAAAFGLSLRAATKPFRLWRQVRREGTDALKTMPGRAATKPLRLARELQDEVGRKMRELL